MNSVIQAKSLFKKYGHRVALSQVSFEIMQGECFGVLGPNGAGKSTLMKLMYGSAKLDSGELFVLGLNTKQHISEIKSKIGVVPQEDGMDTDLNAKENLYIFAKYLGLSETEIQDRISLLIKMLRLDDHQEKSIYELSGGIKRRLGIARSLLNDPKVLFLDEPTTGLDPQSRYWIWEFFKKQKNEKTLVLTTHYMEEAEQLCDRVAIVDQGKLLELDSPKELISKHIGHEVIEFYCEPKDLLYYEGRLKQHQYQYQVLQESIVVMLTQKQSSREVASLISSSRLMIRKPTLNDVFLKLSGHHLREDV